MTVPRSKTREDSAATTAEAVSLQVQALQPLIESNLSALDDECSMPESISDALARLGVFKMFAPPALGGLGLSPSDGYRLLAQVSALDGSVGWNTMIFALYSSFSGLLHEEQAEEIYGPANAAVAGQLQPGAAVAAPAANGFRVSGRWPFGSGGANATWFVGQCVLGDPPEPPAPGQLPNIRLVFMPREEVEIILNWNTIGLRGTGSNDYVVKDAVIPAERTVNLLSPKPHRPEPIYRFPPLVLFPAILPSVMVGVARAAIDLCCGLIEGKRSGIPPTPVLEQPRAQGELGRADALVESARNYAISLLDEATSCITAGERIPGRLAARLNASAALTSAACRDAIAVAFATAGSRSVHEANRMARHMRDVQAASLHAATSYSQFEMAGRVLLGLQERPLGG